MRIKLCNKACCAVVVFRLFGALLENVRLPRFNLRFLRYNVRLPLGGNLRKSGLQSTMTGLQSTTCAGWGCEIYASAVAYYRGSMGILLVYDVADAKTFHNVTNWMKQIEINALPDVNTILIGNKCDVEEEQRVRGLELPLEEHPMAYEHPNSLGS